MASDPSTFPAIAGAIASGVFALAGVVATSFLAKRRDHENTWRQTKADHYQEFLAALSSNVEGRATEGSQERYTDAFNALSLVASPAVLQAVDAFQAEISYVNTARSGERHDALLSAAIQAMRDDIQPHVKTSPILNFKLLAPPPK